MGKTLKYVSDTEPGIIRRRHGKGFSYTLPNGKTLSDADTRRRIDSLAIPPAYENVWICMEERGHLQATGVDARGRKQYRYHPEWEAARSEQKFEQLGEFGAALPRIRRRIRRDMDAGASDENAILAAMAALIDKVHLRVGNRAYAKENHTYGVASLLKRHIEMNDGVIRLCFAAKGGKIDEYELVSPVLHDLLEEIADLPGRDLFSWRAEEGVIRTLDSGRLNEYLAEIAGPAVTAKTFRTWAGSLAAFNQALTALDGEKAPRIKDMCEAAALALHNTPAVCRSSYVHPAVLDLADGPAPLERIAVRECRTRRGLRKDENRFLDFLAAAEEKNPAAGNG